MSPEKLARFLYFFYKAYLKTCLKSVRATLENGEIIDLSEIDLIGYLHKNVDIYVQHTELNKDYQHIYNTKLLYSTKEKEPELFNDLEIFMIENFQLFCHSILQVALTKKYPDLKELTLDFQPIDNQSVNLLELVEDAENS